MCVCMFLILIFFPGVIKVLYVEHESNLVIKIKPPKEWVFHEIYLYIYMYIFNAELVLLSIKTKSGGFANNTSH